MSSISDWIGFLQDNKKGKLLKNHTRDIRRDTMGGAGQAEAGLVGRWLAKKSKQNASASRQMADKLVRLSPKSLLTMFKKTSLQPLPLNSAVLTSSPGCLGTHHEFLNLELNVNPFLDGELFNCLLFRFVLF